MPIDHNAVTALRRRQSLSQTTLAHLAGTTQPVIARIESGQRPDPAMSTVERIAEALGVGVEQIIRKESCIPNASGQ